MATSESVENKQGKNEFATLKEIFNETSGGDFKVDNSAISRDVWLKT